MNKSINHHGAGTLPTRPSNFSSPQKELSTVLKKSDLILTLCSGLEYFSRMKEVSAEDIIKISNHTKLNKYKDDYASHILQVLNAVDKHPNKEAIAMRLRTSGYEGYRNAA